MTVPYRRLSFSGRWGKQNDRPLWHGWWAIADQEASLVSFNTGCRILSFDIRQDAEESSAEVTNAFIPLPKLSL